MDQRGVHGLSWGVLFALLVACSPSPSPPAPTTGGEARPSPAASPKRATVLTLGEIIVLAGFARQGGSASATGIEMLLNAGLSVRDNTGSLRPVLAEQVPTIENGLWKVLPDGRMETTWRLKPDVKWHDGTPFTAADVLFTAALERDPEIPRATRPTSYAAIDRLEAPDERTVTIFWKQPYIDADKMFSNVFTFTSPLPRHILEQPYLDNKQGVVEHPFWTTDFVGTGPYRLRAFERGSYVTLQANSDYALGRPKIDDVEVRMITDPNAMATTILAGIGDASYGTDSLAIDEALRVREQWREGHVEFYGGLWVPLYGQYTNPSPPIVANPQFRAALYHAIDRTALVETFQQGAAQVMDSLLLPGQAQYRDIEGRIMKYPYDPRRAVQVVEGLGYSRAGDGFFRDAAGQRLTVELRATTRVSLQLQAQSAIAGNWQAAGVDVEQLAVPQQRSLDNEYRRTMPGFEVIVGTPADTDRIGLLHSSALPTAANNFQGGNYSRYSTPQLDALVERYRVTIPLPDRIQVLGQIIAEQAESLAIMPLMNNPTPVFISNRLQGSTTSTTALGNILWNAHEWDVR
jgi:peptide/nickel transport system substrate-binding protein